MQIIPTLGSKVCKHDLLGAIWSPRVWYLKPEEEDVVEAIQE